LEPGTWNLELPPWPTNSRSRASCTPSLAARGANWLARHQNHFNFWIHMLGIPLAVAGLPLLFLAPWYYGVGAIAGGYFLQWVGHRVEGNDVGEFIPVKRLLGLPVVAIATAVRITTG